MIKIDLHTHSYGSPDGGITLKGYRKALASRLVDYVAVTDHNSIAAAREIKKVLGDRIIIGEEIMTTDGEIIGLYLRKEIAPGMSAAMTAHEIKLQGGLVYIPHPFEKLRKGIQEDVLREILPVVDIIEVRNGRALVNLRGNDAKAWASLSGIASASSSDAHSYAGLGRSYTKIPHKPTKGTLLGFLGSAELVVRGAKLHSLLAPKTHRIRKKVAKRG